MASAALITEELAVLNGRPRLTVAQRQALISAAERAVAAAEMLAGVSAAATATLTLHIGPVQPNGQREVVTQPASVGCKR